MIAIQGRAHVLAAATAVYTDMINERRLSLDEIGPTVFSMDAEPNFFETRGRRQRAAP
ncbi:hypothetical protein J7L85_03525 [candidate division WOR-3 bacterium]|nr:hypothetical protein [candidate division WOR-3 bacterium]